MRAAEDAGIDPKEIDGFASYSNDRNDPSRIAAALGILAGQKMSFSGAIPDNFAGAGDLETFGDRLTGLDGFRFSLHLRLALPPKKGRKK